MGSGWAALTSAACGTSPSARRRRSASWRDTAGCSEPPSSSSSTRLLEPTFHEEDPALCRLDARGGCRRAAAGRGRALRLHRPPLRPEVVGGRPRAHHPDRFRRDRPRAPRRDRDIPLLRVPQRGFRRSGLHRYPAGRVPLCGQSDARARRGGRAAQRPRLGARHPPRGEAGRVAAALHALPRVHAVER